MTSSLLLVITSPTFSEASPIFSIVSVAISILGMPSLILSMAFCIASPNLFGPGMASRTALAALSMPARAFRWTMVILLKRSIMKLTADSVAFFIPFQTVSQFFQRRIIPATRAAIATTTRPIGPVARARAPPRAVTPAMIAGRSKIRGPSTAITAPIATATIPRTLVSLG